MITFIENLMPSWANMSNPTFEFAILGLIVGGVLFLCLRMLFAVKGGKRIGISVFTALCVYLTRYLIFRPGRIYYAFALLLACFTFMVIVRLAREYERFKVKKEGVREVEKEIEEGLDRAKEALTFDDKKKPTEKKPEPPPEKKTEKT